MRCLYTAPDAVASPVVESVSSSSVLVSWSAPDQPNGLVTQYLVERRLILEDRTPSEPVTVTVVVVPPYRHNYEYLVVPPSRHNYEYLDVSTSLRPHTNYEYRVAAQTDAGLTRSSWSRVLTLSARQSTFLFYVSSI